LRSSRRRAGFKVKSEDGGLLQNQGKGGGFCLKKKKDEVTIRSSAAEYLTYVASVGDQQDSIEMRYEEENIWLTQKMMATLYDVSVSAINQHLKKIFEDGELEENSVIKKYLITQTVDKVPHFCAGFFCIKC
jgi:hypothetical protein